MRNAIKMLLIGVLAVLAVLAVAGCSGHQAREAFQKPAAQQQAVYAGDWASNPANTALVARGYTPAHYVYQRNGKVLTVVGVVYIKCDGENAQDCANHYITLMTNKDPGVWVKNDGTVVKLLGSSDLTGDNQFYLTVPEGTVYLQDGSSVTWNRVDTLSADQLNKLLGSIAVARSLYSSTDGYYYDATEPVDGLGLVAVGMQNAYTS